MKKQDIRNAYTKAVTDLLAAGYTIFPDTMGGSQGEIAHIDLTDGSEILRVLLARDRRWDHAENGYCGDTIVLTVGKAAPDTCSTNASTTSIIGCSSACRICTTIIYALSRRQKGQKEQVRSPRIP